MRLLLAYRDDVDVHGGAGRVMTETADALRALGSEVDVTFDARPDARGYDAVVAVNVWQPQSALAQLRHLRGQGVPIVWLPIYLGYEEFAWVAPAVRQIFRADHGEAGLRRLLADFAAGRYEVDAGDRTLRRDGRNEIYPGFYDELQAMVDLVDHVCVVSHHEVQAIARATKRFATPFTVARHGVDAETFAQADGGAFREAYGIDGDFVLCVGAVDTRKNQLLLIEALRDTDLQVVLAGPSFEPDYLELCLERGGDQVRWLDRIPRKLVASALKAAGVHALPSWAEGAALASMEAAAAGTPVVVSDRTSEFEYFGDLAQFCDPSDPASIRAAVFAALDSRQTRPELPALLAERMRGFTWQAAGEAVLSACERARAAQPVTERRGVAVLGMHRSGTSAATRLVSLLGLPLSPDDDQIPVDEKNPTGYWESASLVTFNNELLAAIDCDPWTIPVLDHGWERDWRLDELRRTAGAAFDRVFPGEHWVWKDPRACLTLPFWRAVTGADPVCLIVLRNPLEVARSLATREGFSPSHSVALWERYTRAAIAAATGRPTRVTTYEQLLTDPQTWCTETAAFLRAHGIPAEDASPEAVAEFVDPTLRHSAFQASALLLDPAVSKEQHALYQCLLGAAGDHEAFELEALPEPTAAIDELLAGRRLAYLAERGDPVEPTLSELLGESIRRVVTIATAEDLAAAPDLLAAYTTAFTSADDATLVVLADDVAAATDTLLRVAAQSGADVQTGPDMLVATPPPGTEELIAQAAAAQLTERADADGPYAHVPTMNARRLLDLAYRCRTRDAAPALAAV